jgi:hypothetical protein
MERPSADCGGLINPLFGLGIFKNTRLALGLFFNKSSFDKGVCKIRTVPPQHPSKNYKLQFPRRDPWVHEDLVSFHLADHEALLDLGYGLDMLDAAPVLFNDLFIDLGEEVHEKAKFLGFVRALIFDTAATEAIDPPLSRNMTVRLVMWR